jgi:hypothetical protein
MDFAALASQLSVDDVVGACRLRGRAKETLMRRFWMLLAISACGTAPIASGTPAGDVFLADAVDSASAATDGDTLDSPSEDAASADTAPVDNCAALRVRVPNGFPSKLLLLHFIGKAGQTEYEKSFEVVNVGTAEETLLTGNLQAAASFQWRVADGPWLGGNGPQVIGKTLAPDGVLLMSAKWTSGPAVELGQLLLAPADCPALKVDVRGTPP